MDPDKLGRQIAFIVEIDKLKQVLRQNVVIDRSRQENSAEHSWHLAVMAVILADLAAPEVQPLRVLKMLLIHDLVEIDAGDSFLYDAAATADQAAREAAAAARLFDLLPADLGRELAALWAEFDAGATHDAAFARALDHLQPVLLNYHTDGGSWRRHDVVGADVLAKKRPIERGSPALWR
ncbi:MAG: HD domain-containing protein [Pseudomonadota bacterium]